MSCCRLRRRREDGIQHTRYTGPTTNYLDAHQTSKLDTTFCRDLCDERSQLFETRSKHSIPLLSAHEEEAVFVRDQTVCLELGRVDS